MYFVRASGWNRTTKGHFNLQNNMISRFYKYNLYLQASLLWIGYNTKWQICIGIITASIFLFKIACNLIILQPKNRVCWQNNTQGLTAALRYIQLVLDSATFVLKILVENQYIMCPWARGDNPWRHLKYMVSLKSNINSSRLKCLFESGHPKSL